MGRTKKQLEVQSVKDEQGSEWVMAGEAAKILSKNSPRKVSSEYPFKLGEMGKVRIKKMSARVTLYNKADLEAYIVEPRGKKSGRAKAAARRRSTSPPDVARER